MGRYTGKSDFGDWCNMHYTPETVIEKAVIYLGDAEVKKDKPEDLIPYYTHLISSLSVRPEKQTISLSSQSWINLEERERIAIMLYDMIKAARRAKKEKTVFDFDYYKNQKDYCGYADKAYVALYKNAIDIINTKPDIIKEHLPADYRQALFYLEEYTVPHYFYRLHDPMHNHMREDFVRYAAENGYNASSCGNFTITKPGKLFHPVISSMNFMISDYYKMLEKYGA